MKVRFLKKLHMNFRDGTLYRDPTMEGQPLSRAEVASIWKSLPTTGSMWIERQAGGRTLCAQTADGETIHEIGRVSDTVRVGGGDFHTDGSFRPRRRRR